MYALFVPGTRDEWQRLNTISVSVGPENLVFDYGRVYLICEKRADKALKIAQDFVYSGSDLLCVSRVHPDLLQERWPDKGVESVWLSERAGPNNISPEQLSRTYQRIIAFLNGKKNGVVLLDGIEYLCLFNDFTRIQMFIEQVSDLIMASHAILVIPIDPQSLDPRSLARLRRYAEVVQ